MSHGRVSPILGTRRTPHRDTPSAQNHGQGRAEGPRGRATRRLSACIGRRSPAAGSRGRPRANGESRQFVGTAGRLEGARRPTHTTEQPPSRMQGTGQLSRRKLGCHGAVGGATIAGWGARTLTSTPTRPEPPPTPEPPEPAEPQAPLESPEPREPLAPLAPLEPRESPEPREPLESPEPREPPAPPAPREPPEPREPREVLGTRQPLGARLLLGSPGPDVRARGLVRLGLVTGALGLGASVRCRGLLG